MKLSIRVTRKLLEIELILLLLLLLRCLVLVRAGAAKIVKVKKFGRLLI